MKCGQKHPKNDRILFLKLKKSHITLQVAGFLYIAQIKAETINFHVKCSKTSTWGVIWDSFSFKTNIVFFGPFWATFPSLATSKMSQNALNGAKMVVPESRKTHKFQACKCINPGWSYGGFSKA